MNKRVVIQIQEDVYIIAVNTELGTIRETIYRTRSMLLAVMIVRGYLKTWDDIEIHPGNSKSIYDSIAKTVDRWKDTI